MEPLEEEALEPPGGSAEPPRLVFGAEPIEGFEEGPAGERKDRADGAPAEGADVEGAPADGAGALRPLDGHGGCNAFRGAYRVRAGGGLSVSDLSGGGATCLSAEAMELESAFLGVLAEATGFRFDGRALLLDSPIGRARLLPAGGSSGG